MRKIIIKDGSYFGKTFTGEYEMVLNELSDHTDLNHESGKTHKAYINFNGKKRGIWVNPEDVEYVKKTAKDIKFDEDSLKNEINKRFKIMNLMGNGVISGSIRSMIIAGAAGIGKTFSLERKLEAAQDNNSIEYTMVKGKISPIGLYVKLFENKEKNSVIVLDDVDVFSDLDTLNILKAALDSGEKRLISWATASPHLENNDIPKEFEFEGSVVFITNMNVDKVVNSTSKLAPHMAALVSRSIYLDLKVHTNKEIMIRVNDVISNTTMLYDKGLDEEQIKYVMEYMNDNVDNLRNVSLRTALHIADFINTDPENWNDIADVCLLK